MLIFEESQPGRAASAQLPDDVAVPAELPQAPMRDTPVGLPEVSELQAVRHSTDLSRRDFSIDSTFLDLAYVPGGAGGSKARAA